MLQIGSETERRSNLEENVVGARMQVTSVPHGQFLKSFLPRTDSGTEACSKPGKTLWGALET